ncbi:hypothetical protein Trydic_g16245 [Trypoxylus dichotomus]
MVGVFSRLVVTHPSFQLLNPPSARASCVFDGVKISSQPHRDAKLSERPATQSTFGSGKQHLRRSVRVPFLDVDQQAGCPAISLGLGCPRRVTVGGRTSKGSWGRIAGTPTRAGSNGLPLGRRIGLLFFG